MSLVSSPFAWSNAFAISMRSGPNGEFQLTPKPIETRGRGVSPTKRSRNGPYGTVYSVLATAPVFTHLGHVLYAAVSFGGGAAFLILAFRLWRSQAGEKPEPGPDGLYSVKPGAREARDLFAFSILYLTLLFAALLAEHAGGLLR